MAINACPKCGHERKHTDTNPEWQCPACGIAYKKYSAALPRSEAPLAPPPNESTDKTSSIKSVPIKTIVFVATAAILVFAYIYVTNLIHLKDSLQKTNGYIEEAIKIKHENETWEEEVQKARAIKLQQLSLQIANESVALSGKSTARITHPILHNSAKDYTLSAAHLIIISEETDVLTANAAQAMLIAGFAPSRNTRINELQAGGDLAKAVGKEVTALADFSKLYELTAPQMYTRSLVIDAWMKERKQVAKESLDLAKATTD